MKGKCDPALTFLMLIPAAQNRHFLSKFSPKISHSAPQVFKYRRPGMLLSGAQWFSRSAYQFRESTKRHWAPAFAGATNWWIPVAQI
jgi:hypothetical protein